MAITVINTWSKNSDGYVYGTSQQQITNTTGNWLFAIVQWDEVQDPDTLVYVSDDAHNFWQPVALSPTGRSVRTAILVAQNALATPRASGLTAPGITTVSFAGSGFIRNPIFTIIEVQGLQAGYVVDNISTEAQFASTSNAQSLVTSQVDFVLMSWVCQGQNNLSGTFNTAGIGGAWTTVAQHVNNSTDPIGIPSFAACQGYSIYQAGVAAGTYSATLANSVSSNWAGVTIGVVAAGGLPQNPFNLNWPLVQCQAAFGALPGAQSTYYTWTDITPRYLGIKGSRGIDLELAQLDASDFTVQLDNHDGAFNPFNASSPYYPNVQLVTPIRVLYTWQGRTYQVFNGHLAFIPQEYEGQFGIVQAECWDDYAKLPLVVLQSAMIEEAKYDNPLFLWPLNDAAGITFASNLSGVTFGTLDVFPSSAGGGTNAFGVTPNPALGGSQGTVWSQTVTNFTSQGTQGSTLRYWDQAAEFPAISPTGVAFEVWAQMPSSNTANGVPPGAQTSVMAVEGELPQTLGLIFSIDAAGLDTTAGTAHLSWYDNTGAFHRIDSNTQIWDNKWHHFFMQVTDTTYALWIDGVNVLSGGWSLASNTFKLFDLAGRSSRFVKGTGNFTQYFMLGQFTMAAIYAYKVDPERIISHFTSGLNGFTHETTGVRVSRFLQYAHWSKSQAIDPGTVQTQALNYLGGGVGYGSGGLASAFGFIGSFGQQHPTGAQGNTGAQADIAIQDLGLTENGAIYIDHNGTIIFHGRDNLYNRGIVAQFTDTFIPVNKNPYFRNINLWSGVHNAAVSQGLSTWSFSGIGSLLITPDGVTAQPGAQADHAPVNPSTSYTFDCWAFSPQGWPTGVQLAILWYDSTNTFISQSTMPSGRYLPPVTPTQVSFTAISPSNAAFGKLQPMLAGTPASSVLFLVDRATLSATGIAAQYEEDVKINYDITNLFNDVQVTRNFDQAFARIVDPTSVQQYFPRVYTRIIFSAYENPPVTLNDNAAWVLSAYKQPLLRVESMKIEVGPNPDYWDIVLRADIGDLITFSRTAPGTTQILAGFVILKIEPEITQDVATFTYSLGPILNPVLTLDDPALGLLGPNSLGF